MFCENAAIMHPKITSSYRILRRIKRISGPTRYGQVRRADLLPDRPTEYWNERKACFPARAYVGDGGFYVGGDSGRGAPLSPVIAGIFRTGDLVRMQATGPA
jgi:hypothetical protein